MDLSRFNNGELILLASFALAAIGLICGALVELFGKGDDDEEEEKKP